ncbi:MAG: hypothetical protein ACLFQ9_03485 [Desulfobacterales bacterium]
MFDTAINALDRDSTGLCKGECRDRVREGEDERQLAINREQVGVAEDYPAAGWAKKRKMQPGVFGGHV